MTVDSNRALRISTTFVFFLALLSASSSSGQNTCSPESSRLCLNQGRFRVEVDWVDFDGNTGTGRVVPFGSDDSGLFWFFDADNWEMLVKVLDGCSINDNFWVFSAATTNVEYTLRVTDTLTNSSRRYRNPLGNAAAALTDTGAFATCSAAATTSRTPSAATTSRIPSDSVVRLDAPTEDGVSVVPIREGGLARFLKQAACPTGAENLCLNNERFRVEVDWRDFNGNTGTGKVVPFGSDDSGLFWFFDADNWEMLVKVLDGCSINNRFWVFSAATTNVEYTLRVTDTVTNDVSEYFNFLGVAADAITDTMAFDTCDAVADPVEPGKDNTVEALPPLSIDPPTPAGSSSATVRVDAPGTDRIEVTASGDGCGGFNVHSSNGELLEVNRPVAAFGVCRLEAVVRRGAASETYRTSFTVEPTEVDLPAVELVGGLFVPGNLSAATGQAMAPNIDTIDAPSTLINGGTAQLRVRLRNPALAAGVNSILVKTPTAAGFDGHFRAPVTRQGNVLIAELSLAPDFFDPGTEQAQRRFASQAQIKQGFEVFVQLVDFLGRIGSIFTIPFDTEQVGSEDVQVSLSWDTLTDVDLHVVEPPPGEEIYFGNRFSSTGGQLDLDSNAACFLDEVNNENVTWPSGAPLPGEHIVRVDYWSNCGGLPANFTVTTRVCGETRTFSGSFSPSQADQGGAGSGIEITRFTPDQCSFRVRGKATYEDRPQTANGLGNVTPLPIRFARVVVRRASNNAILAEGSTKQDGTFDLQFQNSGASGYFVEVRAEQDNAIVRQEVVNQSGTIYSARSTGTINESTEPDKTGVTIEAMAADSAPAFNIFDVGVTGADFYRSHHGVTPSKVTWLWTSGRRGACSSNVSCFQRSANRISVLSVSSDPDEYDDMVLLHEYGHKWQHEQSRSDSPGGPHSSRRREDPQLAWGEGSATYFATRAKGSSIYIDTNASASGVGNRYDIDRLPANIPLATSNGRQNGDHSEALVAAILWDLSDGGTEANDTVANEQGVFTAASYLGSAQFNDRATAGADLVDFLDGWFCKGNGTRGNAMSGVQGIVVGIHQFPYDFADVGNCP